MTIPRQGVHTASELRRSTAASIVVVPASIKSWARWGEAKRCTSNTKMAVRSGH